MSIKLYDIGDLVRCKGTFAETTAPYTAVDPTTLTFKCESPSGTVTTLVYGTDGALLRLTTGEYYVDVTPDEAGTWTYKFIATGTGQSAGELYFRVRQTAIPEEDE